MSKSASKIVTQAQAWLGCKESDGSHKKIIDVYNSHKPLARGYTVKYTDEWCATFVSAVAIKVGYTDIIPTECSCEKMIELFKKLGAWVEDDAYVPNAGDVIFYDWQDDGVGDNKSHSDHVGYVESVANGKITIIEGNCSEAVKRRTIQVNGRYIRGYGVPKYAKVNDTNPDDGVRYNIRIDASYKKDEVENAVAKLKAAGFNAVAVKIDNVNANTNEWVPKIGDTVYFKGTKHYANANASTGVSIHSGEAKITDIYRLGESKHPYHLKRTGSFGPFGWVDADTFIKV